MRRRAASKVGKGKPSKEIAEPKGQLADLYSGVLAGMIDSKIGTTAAQIAHARIWFMEAERKIWETDELEKRLEESEDTLSRKKQASGWGG